MTDVSEIEDTVAEEQFNRAAKYLETIANDLDQNVLLKFYALYKQATVGDCNTSKPGMFSLQAKAKWNSWNDLKGTSKVDASNRYVTYLTEINAQWPIEAGKLNDKWVSVSRPQIADLEELDDADKTCFDFVKEGNVKKLQELLDSCVDVAKPLLNAKDDTGMSLVHWAADRGYSTIIEILFKYGADVNIQDAEGQTALHYAASIGHIECVQMLMAFGADLMICDNDGQNCIDVAQSSTIIDILNNYGI